MNTQELYWWLQTLVYFVMVIGECIVNPHHFGVDFVLCFCMFKLKLVHFGFLSSIYDAIFQSWMSFLLNTRQHDEITMHWIKHPPDAKWMSMWCFTETGLQLELGCHCSTDREVEKLRPVLLCATDIEIKYHVQRLLQKR